jgi:hypothetical protein
MAKIDDGFSPLYLRREASPTRAGKKRVVAYRDADATDMTGVWGWYLSNKPTRRKKRVMLNCVMWQVVWLPDL